MEAKRHQNQTAYYKWTLRKDREERRREEEAASDDESGEEGYYGRVEVDPYEEWKASKTKTFAKLDEKRKSILKAKEDNNKQARPQVYDRRITIFEMTSTEPYPVKIESPSKYQRSFHKWKNRKERYEAWKEKYPGIVESEGKKPLSQNDMDNMRRSLLQQGMTYEEWLGLKERQAWVTT